MMHQLRALTKRGCSCLLFFLLLTTCHNKAQGTDVVAASCVDRCDEQYFPGLPCYCNDACSQYENCCFDYYQNCKVNYTWSEEWANSQGHSYKYFNDLSITWLEAEKACEEHGAMLISINNQEEHQFMAYSVLKKRTLSAFIGGFHASEVSPWLWLDNTPVALPADTFHAWGEGQPGNYDDKNCSVTTNYKYWAVRRFVLDSYIWRAHSCLYNALQEIQGYICERSLLCEPNPCENNSTCQYVGGEEEFICKCHDGFLGDRCQFEVREGELWTLCGETVLTEDSGVITSPLYPRRYPANVRCQWLITTDHQETISLELVSLGIEDVKDCMFDSLTIYDGNSTDAPLLLPPTCGSLDDQDDAFQKQMTSPSGAVLVVFHTDGDVQRGGFQLNYRQQKCGLGSGDSGCGGGGVFTSQCGSIEVDGGPNEPGEFCSWTISVAEDHIIRLNFTKFHIQETGMDCRGGGLAVYDGINDQGALLAIFCGERFPWLLYSQTSRLHLKLNSVEWQEEVHVISAEYTAMDTSSIEYLSDVTEISGHVGSFSTTTSPVNIRTRDQDIYRWLVTVPIGDVIRMQYTLDGAADGLLQIYNGFSEESRLVTEKNTTGIGDEERVSSLEIHAYKVLVVLAKVKRDTAMSLTVSFQAQEWLPEMSGCYRPYYYSNMTSLGTENNVILPMEPLMIMVSDQAFDPYNPGYDAGLYCKWLLEGKEGSRLNLRVLDALIKPVQEDCGYDGLVIYDGNSTTHPRYGPYCGSQDVLTLDVTSSSHHMLVVFYSDTRGRYRPDGILRAMASADDVDCPTWQMNTTSTTIRAECGVIMSPNFPGLVKPGLWTWTLQAPDKAYFTVYPYYIRGPAVQGDCDQYFQLVEVAHDSSQLIQYTTPIVRLCGDTDLFIPPYRIKGPPHNKVMIELNTTRSNFASEWQFKLYFYYSYMDRPDGLEDGTLCPDEYLPYRGNCYRYYSWVLRHYRPYAYSFQATWSSALEQCQSENGTLVSINGADEAYFIKYAFGSPHLWYWDPSATIQVNHRILYIGLHNRVGRYTWTDGTPVGYSDWYEPPPTWAQSPVHEDTLVTDLLYLKNPQPTADVGSLCTVMMMTSPFSSTSWAKIPCDFPIFRAGLICKQPGLPGNSSQDDIVPTTPQSAVQSLAASGSKVCPPLYIMISDHCFRLHGTVIDNVTSDEDSDIASPVYGVENQQLCTSDSWLYGSLKQQLFVKLQMYFDIWRHSPEDGDIWLTNNASGGSCNAIKVYRDHALNEQVLYEQVEFPCDESKAMNLRYALCETTPLVVDERCGQHEFECDNGMCILVDNVCDGHNNCVDNSDERSCECGAGQYECDNGQCISISLYCDGLGHCDDSSDEERCVYEDCSDSQFHCGDGHCIDTDRKCDFNLDCQNGRDEADETCSNICKGFLCYSGRCLPEVMYKDSISDCPGLSLEDELDKQKKLLTMFDVYNEGLSENKTYYDSCEEGMDHVQCQPGKFKCFPRSSTCVYDAELVDQQRNVSIQTSCRDGAHLRFHCENADCPGMYHCPGSYCIPFSKLCDGVTNCPGGHDEVNCSQFICPAMYKCNGESHCLLHSEVCDGTPQCLVHREDEKYCGLIDPICEECSCTGYVASCEDRGLVNLPIHHQPGSRLLRAISLRGNFLNLTSDTFTQLHWLGRLNLANSSLQGILPVRLFVALRNLFDLNLSNNKLTTLPPGVFRGLQSIRKVDLSNNMLKYISRETLRDISPVHHLVITGNQFEELATDTFKDLSNMRELNTDAYKFCCIAKNTEICTPEADEFSSCNDLMANYALQVSIWVLGTCAFCGNLFVVIWRVRTDRQKVSSFFIINLGCSDFLMGIYMLVIASVDVHYRGRYSVHADTWRSSGLCQFAGMIAMLSSEVSVFMLTAITCDRAMSILFPLKMGNVRMKHARMVAGAGWIICFILSVLPAFKIPYYGDAFFGRTGVCLPFQISNEKAPGWEYSVFIFLIVNLISFIVIFVAYAAIFLRVKTSMKEMGAKSTATTNEYDLAKKLAIIVVTDFLCWVPIILIGFAALGGAKISPQVSAWVAVFILPLNSAANPLLYTISAIDCGTSKRKAGRGYASHSAISSGGRATKMTAMSETSVANTPTVGERATPGHQKTNGAHPP